MNMANNYRYHLPLNYNVDVEKNMVFPRKMIENGWEKPCFFLGE